MGQSQGILSKMSTPIEGFVGGHMSGETAGLVLNSEVPEGHTRRDN